MRGGEDGVVRGENACGGRHCRERMNDLMRRIEEEEEDY